MRRERYVIIGRDLGNLPMAIRMCCMGRQNTLVQSTTYSCVQCSLKYTYVQSVAGKQEPTRKNGGILDFEIFL